MFAEPWAVLWPILAVQLLIPGSSHNNMGVCPAVCCQAKCVCAASESLTRPRGTGWYWKRLRVHAYVCLVQAVLQPLFWKWPEAEPGTQHVSSKWCRVVVRQGNICSEQECAHTTLYTVVVSCVFEVQEQAEGLGRGVQKAARMACGLERPGLEQEARAPHGASAGS